MTFKKMLALSKKRTKIWNNIIDKIELVEKGELDITDKNLLKLQKEIEKINKQYDKALKNGRK